jgi:hypothetical protein
MTRPLAMAVLALASAAAPLFAEEPRCAFLCAPEFKAEPTITFGNVFGRARIARDGTSARQPRGVDFELILATDVPTRVSWLGFSVEAIFLPFDSEATPELEFEAKFYCLPGSRTGGWVSSHFDVVDKFSPNGRPDVRRAYSHKLNLELDTSVAPFSRLAEGRWLRGVEVEVSLDYVATGLPRAGDETEDGLLLSHASPWSLSLVVVLPIASH